MTQTRLSDLTELKGHLAGALATSMHFWTVDPNVSSVFGCPQKGRAGGSVAQKKSQVSVRCWGDETELDLNPDPFAHPRVL